SVVDHRCTSMGRLRSDQSVGVLPSIPWSIGAFCVAPAAAIEPSESTLAARPRLIGRARFAFTSDIAVRSGSNSLDSLRSSRGSGAAGLCFIWGTSLLSDTFSVYLGHHVSYRNA